MKGKSPVLEIDKCVVARLWYTTLKVLLKEIHSSSDNYTRDEILQLISIIQSETVSRIDRKDRWIIWKILDLLGVNSLSEKPNRIQFTLALKFISQDIPEDIEEELSELFRNVCESKSIEKNVNKISEDSLQFLYISLHKYPSITSIVIKNLLCVWSPFFNETDKALQNLYFKSLKEFLKKDQTLAIPENERTSQFLSQYEKSQPHSQYDSNGTLLSILSKLELTDAKNEELLTWLFPALFEYCKTKDVTLALYARRSTEYFNEWVTFTEKVLLRSQLVQENIGNSERISNAIFKFDDDDVDINSEELAYRTIKLARHWLLDILDICYALLATGSSEKVSTLLSVPILHGLWPTVLFKVLYTLLDPVKSIFGKDEEISLNLSKGLRFVLDKCAPFFIDDKEIWNKLRSGVEIPLDTIDWVLKNRKIFPQKEFKQNDLTIKSIFSLLMSNGILSTLNTTRNLPEGNFKEIEDLLKYSPESWAQFKAYQAMICTLKAVLLSDSYSSKARDIGEYLTEMKSTLKNLFPFETRLEVIENIFSMIFLRLENFSDDDNNFEESEGEMEEKQYRGIKYKRIQSGFLCNQHIIRDLLHYLRASILDFEIDYKPGSSNSFENVKTGLTNVSKALDDAAWRLELLTSSEFVRKVGHREIEASDIKENFYFSEILLIKKLNASKILTNKSIFYQQDDSSSSEDYNKSEIDLSSDAGLAENNNGFTTAGGRKKFSKKNTNSITENSSTFYSSSNSNFNSNSSFILNFMLSSKESLIIQCLWKCDFDRAQQVIETFYLKDSQLDGEVRFSKAMAQFRQRIEKEDVEEVFSPVTRVNQNREISTLQNIRQAVQEGIQTSRLTGQLETFLASNKAILRLINPGEVNTNEILTMAVIDLALTTGHTRSCSINVCDVATKYLKSCKMMEKTVHSAYFYNICKLLYESKIEASLPDILCDVRVPLSIQKFNENLEFWKEVEKIVRIFTTARLDRGKFSKDIEHKVLNLLSTLYNGDTYLSNIFVHLNILQTILPKKISDGNWDGSPFSMLEISVQSYFGHQFVELGVGLEDLEGVAKKLGINLVHSILVSCCPKFTFHGKINKIETANQRGYIILNEDFQDKFPTQYDMEKPTECVLAILSELLNIIAKIYPNKSTLRYTDVQNLSTNIEIHNILQKTSCLKNINLCELSDGNETLTFFLNIWNLMFCHSLITIWSIDSPCNRLQHVLSSMKIAYQIGDLGLVTLAELRSKLLGNLTWDLEFFKQTSEDVNEIAWQDLDLDQDPRVIFAMANEFFGTPAVQIYEPKNLDEELNKSIRNYIACYNLIESGIDKDEIDVCWLPEIVCRYQDFLLENASLARQNVDLNFDESFTLRKFLNTSENNVEFKYKPSIYQYEMRLDYLNMNKSAIKNLEKTTRRFSNNILQCKKTIDDNFLRYLEGHCWLLPYLVQKVHKNNPTNTTKVCENAVRCSSMENLLRAPWTEMLKNTFDENQGLVGMHENISSRDMWQYFECLIRREKWKRCLNIINSLPDNLTVNNRDVISLKDKILSILISSQNLNADKVLKYLRQIKNINVLAHAVLINVKRWSIGTCERTLTYILNHSEKSELLPNCVSQLNATLLRVIAFCKMLPHFENNLETKNMTWYGTASETNKTESLKIVKSLIDANKFQLCFEWLKFHTSSNEIQSLVAKDLLIGLLENEQHDFESATKLLQALSINRSLKLCNRVLKKLECVPAIKFVTNYLLDHSKPGESLKYRKILVSIEILSLLESKERPAFLHLLKHPLLMLEQLLMNGKFEILNKILHAISETLPTAGIALDDIDKIIRYYAGKSLEFRVALQRDGIESKSRDSSSLSTDLENAEFIMPLKVPTKEEWIPNDKSRVCSCCKSVVFSMFNRRHHCRRCGRVVCAVCSQQRMRVQTYPDSVLVRVCDDCKRQSIFRMKQQHGAPPSTPNSETFDYWRLTTDKTHNQTLKDEFSFEHAPSISLCLAILNLHSDHKAYASFLLDRCDDIKQLLRPVASGRVNPEVDHKLLVKMIRSLVVAAKVKCAKLSLNAGLDNCDRMLSHVDLVSTLVQSDCSALVPSDKLDDHDLQRLRDLLTEKEQWILALDVSTKSGLDRQGVWAAWGKAHLKVGCYDQAREKFAHCLEKVSTNGFEDWVFLPNFNQTETNSPNKNENHKIREKTRPIKNPPLLNEILQIIESSNFSRQSHSKSTNSKLSTTHHISVTLNNIKSISQGRYYDNEQVSQTDNSYYHESLHYLISYGSHSSILEFFIKHEKYEDCLLHITDNKVDPEIFFNSVYLPCLKNGCVEKLHESMRAKDSNLITWKNYLVFTCHSLEIKKYANTLYQLQIFTKDYVRASMSCIKFYINGATNYTDLCSHSTFLQQAQKHLETELQVQSSFGTKRRRKSTSSQHSGGQSSLTLELELSEIDRHINTISRQMEIAKFLRNSEQEGRDVAKFLNRLFSMENDSSKNHELPTLFGTQLQKTQLAVLAIVCGRDVEEGFGIAFRIIQDYNLRSEKVYSLTGHILASEDKISSVEQLVKCCRSSGAPDTNALSDRVLAHCVKLVLNSSQMEPGGSSARDKVDSLIRLITDLELKISMCIESRQLKAAYLLAVRHSRAQDVRKIFKEADRLEQNAIKAICAKWLQQTQKS